MGLIKHLIKDVSDDQFIRAVNSSKTYTEIAKKLGAYYSNAPSVVKRRIEQLNIDFKPVSPRYEPDDVFFSEHHYHTSHTLRSRLLKVKDIHKPDCNVFFYMLFLALLKKICNFLK